MSDLEHQLVQRAIVLHLLDSERTTPWTLDELDAAVDQPERDALSKALGSLEEAGAIRRDGEQVAPSDCARRLDELGLIAV